MERLRHRIRTLVATQERRKLVAGALACVALLTAAGIYFVHNHARGCRWISGKWGGDTCYTQLCFYLGDCGDGPWAGVPKECEEVEIGTSEAMLHFNFGNPYRREGERIEWRYGKPQEVPAVAIIKDGRLASITCQDRRYLQ